MVYANVVEGAFVQRLNRFVAEVEVAGAVERVHVRNTGRCQELLVPGVRVYLQPGVGVKRKTKFSLITVQKGERLINIDSLAPNKIFAESGVLPWESIRPEQTFEDSRFDFAVERHGKKGFVEVKGVTLERNGVAYFPDAPTQRGLKHIGGLIRARQQGLLAYLVFIIQMPGITELRPNVKTHPEFAQALERAQEAGVRLAAWQCGVGSDWIVLQDSTKIVL